MGENDDLKIVEVDSMFESFVKKKLQQLGMKRAMAKSTDNGTMNALEQSIKMRLEQNLAQNLVKNKVEDDDREIAKPKKSKKDKKHKKKRKREKREVWEEKKPQKVVRKSDQSSAKEIEANLEGQSSRNGSKVVRKSGQSSAKEIEASLEGLSSRNGLKVVRKSDQSSTKENEANLEGQSSRNGLKVTTDSGACEKSDPKNISEQNMQTVRLIKQPNDGIMKTSKRGEDKMDAASSERDPSTSEEQGIEYPEFLEGQKSVPNNIITVKIESSSSTVKSDKWKHCPDTQTSLNTEKTVTSGPKKDIATIKMKIELLKAKSVGEKLSEELDGLLKPNLQNRNTGMKMEEARKSQKKPESTDLDNRKRRRSRSSSHSKSHPRRRTRSRSRSRSRQHSKSHLKRRIRSRSREQRRSRRRHSRSPSKRSRRRSKSWSRERYRRKRSRKNSRSPLISPEDKVRLLEIAKANALAQHRAEMTANSVSSIGQIVKEGSMSVTELTDLCKDISAGKDESTIQDAPLMKEDAEKMVQEADANKVHHPFAVRESAITFNIKQIKTVAVNPTPAELKPLTVLSKEFPVSCGQQHRRKEVLESVYGKWEVVAKDEATKKAVKELVSSDKVFVEPEESNVSLGAAIAERISAVRQLQLNPNSEEAQDKMSAAQKALDAWTKSQQVPGQFTGHTGLTAMPKSVLESGRQAWFNSDNLKNAKHVSGIGKSLLQKMGWTPGTPLGKTMPGQLEPLSLDFKMDRKGLSSFMEAPSVPVPPKSKPSGPITMDLSNKHPVSALMEICSKRHWTPPDFRLVDPLNMKSFTFRAIVNSNEYVGKPASNKKQAKLLAATVALQNMGLIPKT